MGWKVILAAAAFWIGGVTGEVQAQVVVGGGVTGTSVNVQTLSTGTVLSVTPAVSADRRYVGMAINPQFSTLDGVDTFVLSNATNPGISGGVVGMPGVRQAVAIRPLPFRPAVVGKVTIVENDRTLLATKVKSAQWKDVTLKAAVQKLADGTKLNVVLGIRGLQQAGVDMAAKRDFAVADGTVKEALLALLQAAVPKNDMVITAEDKVIQIETQAQADLQLVTRTYYLEDLLANLPRFVAGDTNLNEIGMGKAGGLDAAVADTSQALDLSKPLSNVTPPSNTKAAMVAPNKVPASTNILEVITDTVRPEIWKNHGGKCEISMVGNRVTIKVPASVHVLLDGPKVYQPDRVPAYVNYAR